MNGSGRNRRSGITGRSFEELIDKRPNGCWIWRGSVHHSGQPIYKGWNYARRIALDKFARQFNISFDPTKHRAHGTTCAEGLCVAPKHIAIFPRRHTTVT